MALRHATKQLLESIRFRLAARLRGELTSQRLERALEGLPPVEEFDFPEWAEPLQLKADYVLRALPNHSGTLALDTWEILWSEVVEGLVEHQEVHCDGLGRFRFDADRGAIQFRADQSVNEVASLALVGEESVWSVAMVATAEGASLADLEGPLLLQPDSTPEFAAAILHRIGSLSASCAIKSSTADVASDAALATVVFAAYQSLLWAIGQQLKDTERVEVPMIGTFTASLEVVSFEAADDLIDLLSTNDRVSG